MSWSFLHAEFVHLVWLAIALVAVLAWLDARGRERLARFVSHVMQAQLAHRATGHRRALALVAVLLTCLFGVAALMRPQITKTETVTSKRVAADIVVLLDVSRSMLAQDAAPTRLERAKAEIRDMIGQLPGNRFGLVAFAGRAVVVSPLTTDYGFFRMSLDAVDTTTVGRGGTRIGDGIRKAVATFPQDRGGKLLLLITDGEDHESYPLEAAQAALEAGVRIVAIGFGDEKGSEIQVTNAKTGVIEPLRDRNQKVVISRLDGATLRDIAFRTEGVYVPAGVAVLDLETIVEEHIEPLMEASNEASTRTATTELYPWLVLGALLSLFLAAVPATARRRSQAAALLVIMLGAGPAHAGKPSARATYNEALNAMTAGSLDDAEKSFDQARSNAGQDPELRFRVAFNLGLLWAKRADLPDGNKKKAPEEQVDALEHSAAWFRDAIRLHPKDKDARVNLEIVLRQMQALADEINKGKNGLEPRIDRLIDDQRGLRDGVRQLMANVAAANAKSDPEMFRDEFREIAQLERQLLAEAGTVFDMAAGELDQLTGTPEEERTDEQRGRMFQLQSFSNYLETARQTMADARQRLRRLEGDRAHEQSNAALAGLKRAREQLQDPVRVLRGLLQDEARLQAESQALARLRKDKTRIPKWLTLAHLGVRQRGVHERASELLARLQAGVSQQPIDNETSSDPEAHKRAKLLATVRLALPHVQAATVAMDEAAVALGNDRLATVDVRQTRVRKELVLAIEQFSNIRGLIELAYSDQQHAKRVLAPTEGADLLSAKQQAQFLADVIKRNRDRLERLAGMFQDNVQAIGQTAQGAQAPSAEDIEQQKALYTQAENERVAALDALTRMKTSLRRFGQGQAAQQITRVATDDALERIEALRRLFFSVVEHLQELGREQADTLDSTASSQALASLEEMAQALGPLVGAQAGHTQKSDAIAQALEKQADQAAQPGADPAVGTSGGPAVAPRLQNGPGSQLQQALAEAANEVNLATSAMKDAHAGVTQAAQDTQTMSIDMEPTIASQKKALEHIAKAIALLQPPDDKKKEQSEQDEPQEKQSREQAARRLQEIRDREAQRRRNRRPRQQKSEPVEKDW